MKINYIKTIGFRKFKKVFETDLYDVTNITGRNRAGKSNILYAIINIFLGSNLSGDEKTCLINKNCDASYGEIHFIDNQGKEHILIRGKHKFDNKRNFISLDGKVVNQTELACFYKDKKLFLSILNPLYFLMKKPAEQKEMVDKYLSDIAPKNLIEIVYNNLSKEEQQILEGIPNNIPDYIYELNGNIKKAEDIISNLNGKIEYAQNIVDEKLPEYIKFEKEVELSLSRQELDFIKSDSKILDKEKQKQLVDSLEKEINNKKEEITKLEKSMKDGKSKYLSIKSGSTCNCPTCNQIIKDMSKIKTIENMRNSLIQEFNKKELLEAEKKDIEVRLMVERCNYHALETESTENKAIHIAELEENIKNLEKEQSEIEKQNNEIKIKCKNISTAKLDIERFNNEIISQQKLINSNKKAKEVAQKLYISYIEEKMKLAKQYLKNVDIKFYSVLKTTGEIKEDFIITYKNNTLANLSSSETIATALEFANMFNQVSNTHFPIFIDDYESCADYDFIKDYSSNSQLFISKVQKGTSLKIADYSNSNNYTIIKPNIVGRKTLHLFSSKSKLLQKVA